jgi:hypothetical protein
MYVKAEIRTWDYVDVSFVARTDAEKLQTRRDDARIGSTFDKAVFVEYTDATFRTPVPRKREHEVRLAFLFS